MTKQTIEYALWIAGGAVFSIGMLYWISGRWKDD